MNNEEAIEYLKNLIKNPTISQDPFYTTKIAIDTVLIYIEELKKEVEQLKVNEEILMKTKGCLDKDSSTDCRVLESLSYGIRAYEKTLRNSVHKDKIRELKEKIHNALDNNGITRAYQIKIDEYFEELLEEEKQ